MSIITDIQELLICAKNVKPSHFHDVIEIGYIEDIYFFCGEYQIYFIECLKNQ